MATAVATNLASFRAVTTSETAVGGRRRGGIRRHGPGWQVRVSAGTDPSTGERIVLYRTVPIPVGDGVLMDAVATHDGVGDGPAGGSVLLAGLHCPGEAGGPDPGEYDAVRDSSAGELGEHGPDGV